MEHIYNFSAGPAILPAEVLQQARDEMLDWHGSGMSVMEMSHRGKEFMSIAEKTEADFANWRASPIITRFSSCPVARPVNLPWRQ